MAALSVLEIVAGIDAAIAILNDKRAATVRGNDAVFQKICRAQKHLGLEIEAILAPDPEPPEPAAIALTLHDGRCICPSAFRAASTCPVHGWNSVQQ